MSSNILSRAALGACFGLGGLLACASGSLAAETPQELANEQMVLDFYAALNHADASNDKTQTARGIAEKYIDPHYVSHGETAATTENSREDFINSMIHPSMPGGGAPGGGAPGGAPSGGFPAGGPGGGAPGGGAPGGAGPGGGPPGGAGPGGGGPGGGGPGGGMPQPVLVAIMAKGDEVVQVTSRTSPGAAKPFFIFNLFRLKNGKLIEHWDAGLLAMSQGMAQGQGPAAAKAGP